MSTISTIYDNLYTILGTLFSSKTELPDPYNISSNPEPLLKNGFGVAWEPGNVNEELAGAAYADERSVGIIFTKMVARLDTNTTARRTVEKALLEDRRTLINYIKSHVLTRAAEYFEFVSDDGFLSVTEEKQNIIYLKMNFTIRYKEVVS